jgi:hypothetical protein
MSGMLSLVFRVYLWVRSLILLEVVPGDLGVGLGVGLGVVRGVSSAQH